MSGDGDIPEPNSSGAGVNGWDDHMNDADNEDLLLLNDDLNLTTSTLRSDEKYAGFDNNAADYWFYPSNLPERAYQFNIVQKALFHNTLVVLPTGLGKTFIAAVVMYNIYRWYPTGKVIFMAPTRPLVAQQVDACCKIVGIPKADSVEITGKLSKASRAQLWQSKRVFFATPQSVQSDILDAELNFPFHAVKLIVVDEAHRAKGRYAYTEVIRYIWSKNKFFRILALSATPGRRKEDVEEVIRNLFISKLEVRTEDSVDVISYVHKRQLKVIVVDLGTKLTKIRDELLEIADPHIRNLIENRLISGRPGSISRNWLVMEHKRFREMTLNSGVPYQKELNSDFNICISVYHAIELLERHGLRVFLNNFDETQEGGPKFVVILRPDLRRLVQRVREETGPNPFAFSDQSMLDGKIAPIPSNIDFGHPKFEIAREHVLSHFESNKDGRVIIFCEYRESVMLMHRLLLQHRPLIRPRLFVGQGGTGSIRAVTQQQQINVMNDFKSGKSNALIATSVAEEGIDVGEVDLIVCFDISTSNPTRFIQRIGRTGRKKEGKVLILATEGKEHSMLKDVLSERNRLNKSITRNGQFNSAFYNHSPRMVPTEFNPKCLKLFIQAPESEEPARKSKDKPAKTTKGNKFEQIGQKKDLTHFFKLKVVLDDEDKAIFAHGREPEKITRRSNLPAPKIKPSTKTNLSASRNITSPDDTDEIIPLSPPSLPPKSITINNKMIKKMAKYIRNTTNGQPIETFKAISSNKLSKDSLQFLIDYSPDILSNIWTRMQELWQKGIDEHNMPLKGITNEDRQIIRSYLQIEKNIASKETFAELIERKRKFPIYPSYSSLTEKYKSIFEDMKHGGICENNFELLIEKFGAISSQFPSEELSNENYTKSMVYDDEINEIDQSMSIFNESSQNYSNDCVLDSKYMSQWGDKTNQTQYSSAVPIDKLNNSNVYNQLKPTPIVAAATNDSDDDVVFVGTTHQSTPIRKGSHKKTLPNFSETPIPSTASKRISQQIPPTKKSQKNILDFMKTKEVKNVECMSSKTESVQSTNNNKNQEEEDENTMNFFDDQFDAIIAANSGILKCIENSNQVKAVTSFENTEKRCINTYGTEKDKSPVNVMKITSTLGSDDSTPDNIISLADETEKQICTNTTTAVDSTPATGTNSLSSKYLKQDQTTAFKSVSLNCESVHPELADIDINDLSEFSMDENVDSAVQIPTPTHRSSPDIFDDLCEPISELKAKEASPVKVIKSPPPAQVSPCLVTKKILTWGQIRQKYIKPSQSVPNRTDSAGQGNAEATQSNSKLIKEEDRQNESVINMPGKIRSKRRLIISDSDSSDDKDSSSIPKKRKPHKQTNQELVRRSLVKNEWLRKKRNNGFINDEAILSGSATEDESEHTIGQYIHDSVVVSDEEEENQSAIPMTGVYLQSVRSPCSNIRGFKIPERRQYNDASKIFSQRVPQDNSSYVVDSFVVVSDDESDVEKSMCPLERAEEILKNKRRAKRKAVQDHFLQPSKKKRVLRIHNSSEDDDDFV